MSSLLLYFFIAIGLSMDAFSLAIAYGTNGISKKNSMILSILVGLFHFIMPNLGSIIGNSFFKKLFLYGNIITGLVFLFLSIQMILSLKDEEDNTVLTTYLEMILFALAVSIDSFSIGIALSIENYNIINAGIVFSITSFIFTFSGFILGRYFNDKIGKISKYVGIIILLVFSFKYLFNI